MTGYLTSRWAERHSRHFADEQLFQFMNLWRDWSSTVAFI